MQAATIVLFTALILGLFLLFLTPGNWWPRRPPPDHREPSAPSEDELSKPPRYPRHLN